MSVRVSLIRRFIKKHARRMVVRTSVSGTWDSSQPGLRILTYHRIASDRDDPFAVDPVSFDLQMRHVSSTRLVSDLAKGVKSLVDGAQGTQVALTFDDGTVDFYERALPILRHYGLPATLYVNPANVGSKGYVSWQDLQHLEGEGVCIGSHSMQHVSLGRMSQADVRKQVVDSRNTLEDRLGRKIVSLAYPFGTLKDFNKVVKEEVKLAGYQFACTSVNGTNRVGVDPFGLLRTKIEQGDAPVFRQILAGSMDGWALVDRYLWFLQGGYE